MERSQLQLLDPSSHLTLTPVQRMLALEFVNISVTDGLQADTRGMGPVSGGPGQSRGQGPGSWVGQAQDERAAQVAFFTRQAVSIFARNPGSDGAVRNSPPLDQDDAPRTSSSSAGTRSQLGPLLPGAPRVPRDKHDERMWLRFRLELLQLETGLAAELSSPVKVWIRQVVQRWWEQQSRKGEED